MQPNIIMLKQPVPELAHLGFHRYLPHPQLRPWIQCYWVARQQQLPEAGFIETLYPDGGSSLTFNFCNHQLLDASFKARQIASKVHFRKTIDCIGVRFNPGGVFALYGMNMQDLGHFEEASPIIPNLNNLLQQLANLKTTHTRLAAIETWLLRQLQFKQPRLGFLQHFIPRFLQSSVSLEEVIRQEAIGRRQLERKFQQEIGLSPSQFKQLHRIKKARYLITLSPLSPLTDIAQDCGFYDQAHFIRQFQKITGQTPGQYRHRKMSQIYNP